MLITLDGVARHALSQNMGVAGQAVLKTRLPHRYSSKWPIHIGSS
jgi:hypothetical protein